MKKAKIFDVLIVYSGVKAVSASSETAMAPFPIGKYFSCNIAYSYFMNICVKRNLSVAFTTSSDITTSGKCSSYWIQNNNEWEKVNMPACSTLIFDKLFPTNTALRAKRDLLFSDPQVVSYSDRYLFELFFDKQKTHDFLSSFSIPTVTIDSNKITKIDTLIESLAKITRTHKAKNDFTDSFILKDRFGAGGNNIFKVDSNYSETIQKIMELNPSLSFILQPYVSFGKGYSFGDLKRATDIRITFEGNKIVQTYIRMAKNQDFRCNQEQGGTLIYTHQKDIPKQVIACAKKIAKALDKKNSLYALDFIVTDSNEIFLLEGNNCPGIYWDVLLPIDERKVKELIRVIVKELGVRADLQKSALVNSFESVYENRKENGLALKN